MSRPQKITFIINNFIIGGGEKLLWDIISRLDKDKFDISIITVFGSGSLEPNFQKLGISIYFAAGKFPFYANKWWYKVYWLIISPIVLTRLIWQLSKLQPVVVVTSLYHADILGMLAAWLVGVQERIIVHHDVYKLGHLKAWLKRVIAIRLATTMVAVSNTVKTFLISYFGADPGLIKIIYNGIDLEKFKVDYLSAHDLHLNIGILGRLEPVKGLLVFIKALQILQKKYKIISPSYIGGDGSLKAELINFVAQEKLLNLNLDGEIQNVPEWLSKIDILVVPSISEGFGLVVLEGLAAGKIVVSSDIPATRELITNGANGCLFKVEDASILADTLHRLITDKNYYEHIKRGIAFWQQNNLLKYDISETAQSYEILFSEVVNQDSNGEIRP